MLELSACVAEGCDEFTFTDTTGPYDATDNPDGYGAENGVTGPAAFTSYLLDVRYPGTSMEDDPDYTFDLGALVPTPDADGHYSWAVTIAMMNLTKLISGVYVFTAIGALSPSSYIVDVEKIFVNDVRSMVDTKMKAYDPTCPCKKGCTSPTEMYAQLVTIECAGICNSDTAQSAIEDLYAKAKNCC